MFTVAPQLVEALAEIGELEGAVEVTACVCERSHQQEHPWGIATAERCDALVRRSREGYDEAAADDLGHAAGAYEKLGLRFDAARSPRSLGRAQRRFKQWGVARRSLEAAAGNFDEIGSPGCAAQSRSEPARVGARRPRPSGELTQTERRTASWRPGDCPTKGRSHASSS